MPILISKEKHYLTRFLPFFLINVIITFAPLILGLIGAAYSEYISGIPCHEGNCSWAVIPWMMIFTIPIGLVLIFILLILTLIDTIIFFKNRK